MAKKTTQAKPEGKKPETAEDQPDLSFLTLWSKKIGRTVDELKKEIEGNVAELKKKHANWDEVKCYAHARRRLYAEFKSEFKSSASPWCLCPLYLSDPLDYGNRRYQAAIDLYAKNPKQALENNMVKVERDTRGKVLKVKPIDERTETKAGKKNLNYGKDLPEHAYIMNIGGIAIPHNAYEKEDWSKARPFTMTLSRNLADPTNKGYFGKGFNFGSWYKVKVSNKTAKENEENWELNATSVSSWDLMKDLELNVEDIPSYFENFFAPLGELNEYHDSYAQENDEGTKSFSNRLVVTKGEVIDIVLSEDGQNSHRIMLDDESIGFGEEEEEVPDSITCWVNPTRNIPFGKYSQVYVFGTTNRSLKKDLATGELSEEWGNTAITMQGFIPIEIVEPEIETSTPAEDEEEVVEVDESDVETPNIAIEPAKDPKVADEPEEEIDAEEVENEEDKW